MATERSQRELIPIRGAADGPEPATYAQFGGFIEDQNPYSQRTDVANPDQPRSGIVVATISETGGDAPNVRLVRGVPKLYWPFRLPVDPAWQRPYEPGAVNWPNDEPGRIDKTLEVESCEIVKAIVVPYGYTRTVGREPPNQCTVDMKSHLVVGYTAPRPITVEERRANTFKPPFISEPYERLGNFIERTHPVRTGELGGPGRETFLYVDFNTPLPPLVMTAICWLADRSKANDVFGSSDDEEMDLCQKQQCLYWGVPQPNRDRNSYYDGWWMRSYQITKAQRVRYTVAGGELIGDILWGYSGSGDT